MKIKYHTSKGSIYIHVFEGNKDYWIKKDSEGVIHPLMGGIHIAKNKLQELVSEYPSSLLDKTYCFDVGVEKEFFEDAKKEKFTGSIDDDETVIFFLVKRNAEKYGIGCSSQVVKIEKVE